MIYRNVTQLIGNTPLLLPENYNRAYCGDGEVLCKLECFNPAGSAKDRGRRDRDRADQRKYGDRTCRARRGTRIPLDPDHARYHE